MGDNGSLVAIKIAQLVWLRSKGDEGIHHPREESHVVADKDCQMELKLKRQKIYQTIQSQWLCVVDDYVNFLPQVQWLPNFRNEAHTSLKWNK